ncbi:MAG: hypothetical protein AB8G05_13870 [Oligoflexales bacterium]
MKTQRLRFFIFIFFLTWIFCGFKSPAYASYILTDDFLRNQSHGVFQLTSNSNLHKTALKSGNFIDSNLPAGYHLSLVGGSSLKPSTANELGINELHIDSNGELEIKGGESEICSRALDISAQKIVLSGSLNLNSGKIEAETLVINKQAHINFGFGVTLNIKNLEVLGELNVPSVQRLEGLHLGKNAYLRAREIQLTSSNPENWFSSDELSELICDDLHVTSHNFSSKGIIKTKRAHLDLYQGNFHRGSQTEAKQLFLSSGSEVSFKHSQIIADKLAFLGKKLKISSFSRVESKESLSSVLESLDLEQTTLDSAVMELNTQYFKVGGDVSFISNVFFLEGRRSISLFGHRNKIKANAVYVNSYHGEVYSSFEFQLNNEYTDEQVKSAVLSYPKLLTISRSIDENEEEDQRPSIFYLRSGKGDVGLDSYNVPYKIVALDAQESVHLATKLRLKPDCFLGIKASDFELRRNLNLSKLNIQTSNILNLSSTGNLNVDSMSLLGRIVTVDGNIETYDLEMFGRDKLVIGPSAINAVKAALGSSRYLNLRQLSQLKILEQLEIKNDEQRLVLGGAITASIVDILAQDIQSSKKSRIEKAQRFSSESIDSTYLSGKIGLNEGGEIYLKGSSIGMENAHVYAPSSANNESSARMYVEASKGSVTLKDTVLDGIKQLDFKAKEDIVLAKSTRINDAQKVNFSARNIDLDGVIKADQVTATARKINYRGKIIDANEVDFFADESIDIATYSLLQVTHRLRIHGDAKVAISGSVLTKILDVCSAEFNLLRSGDLTVDQKAIIYTYAWTKMQGLVNFAKAEAQIKAGESVEIDNTFLYKNLGISGLEDTQLESLLLGKNAVLLENSELKKIGLRGGSNWLEKRLKQHNLSFLDLNKPEDLATIIEKEVSSPEWREMALPLS